MTCINNHFLIRLKVWELQCLRTLKSETRKEESLTCMIFPIVLGRVPRPWTRHMGLGGSNLNSLGSRQTTQMYAVARVQSWRNGEDRDERGATFCLKAHRFFLLKPCAGQKKNPAFYTLAKGWRAVTLSIWNELNWISNCNPLSSLLS